MEQQQLQPQEEPTYTTPIGLQQASENRIEKQSAHSLKPGEEWLERLRRLAHQQKTLAQVFNGLYFMGIGAFLLTFFAEFYGWIAYNSYRALLLVITYTAAIFFVLLARVVWKRAAKKLVKSADIRAIGTLVEGLEMDRAMARDAVIPLLYRLQADDASLLNADQRRILNQYLAHKGVFLRREDIELVRAILHAYRRLGDRGAVPFVQRLAEGHGLAEKDSRVREEAQACLTTLQQRVEQQQAQQTLLRASSSAATPAHDLLRPTHNVTEADPEQLLRASQPEEA